MPNEPSAVTKLKKWSKQSLSGDGLERTLAGLDKESDRAFVIITAAMLEDRLLEEIKKALRPLPKAEENARLYEFDGPLGSFGFRIDMGFALRLIDIETRDALQWIRHCRNACAHSNLPVSFETPELWNVARKVVERDRAFQRKMLNLDPNLLLQDAESRRFYYQMEINLLWLTISHGSHEAMLASIKKHHLPGPTEPPTSHEK